MIHPKPIYYYRDLSKTMGFTNFKYFIKVCFNCQLLKFFCQIMIYNNFWVGIVFIVIYELVPQLKSILHSFDHNSNRLVKSISHEAI